jgi:hypothetical protein
MAHGRQVFGPSAPGDRADGLGQATSANLAGGVEIEAATACEDTEARGCVPDVAFIRRHEPDVPNTSTALRRLIEAGLKATKPKKARP